VKDSAFCAFCCPMMQEQDAKTQPKAGGHSSPQTSLYSTQPWVSLCSVILTRRYAIVLHAVRREWSPLFGTTQFAFHSNPAMPALPPR